MSILGHTETEKSNFAKYNLTENKWFYNNHELELETLILDHESLKTGWFDIQKGKTPDISWDKLLGEKGPRPSNQHNRGFSVKIKPKGYGWAEWTTTSKGCILGFDDVLVDVWAELPFHQNQLPIIRYDGSSEIQLGPYKTRKLKFELVGWSAKISGTNDTEPLNDSHMVISIPVPSETELNHPF